MAVPLSAIAPVSAPGPRAPTFGEAFGVWLKIGLSSFGGPTGQIALMHQELVDRRRWVSEARFLHALNYCMLLPGPEAQQLSIYIGWLLHRTWGGIVAGTLFVVPGALLLWAVSWVYVAHGHVPWIEAIFYGLKPAVMGIVAFAVLRLGRKALKNAVMWSVAALAFGLIYFGRLPFPWLVLGAGLVGLAGGRWLPRWFAIASGHGAKNSGDAVINDAGEARAEHRPSLARSVRTAAVWLAVWAAPLVAVAVALGRDHVLVREGLFFSKASVVTFGGAYAVLPYVAQQAVEQHGWLSQPQMLDGLGLAETTPGPLILVLQFVGFLGAWQTPAPFSPAVAGTLGALMSSWTTFVPSFLFIFLGAPYIEALRGQRLLTAALSTITAAVVGVVLNLAVWFVRGVVWPQGGTATDWFAVIVSAGVFVGMLRWKWHVVPVVLGCGLLGLIARAAG